MNDPLFDRLEILKTKYNDPEDQDLLSEMEKSLRVAVLTSNLRNNDAMKLILAEYRKELDNLQRTLVDSEALFNSDDAVYSGRLIHARIKWCKKFLAIFERADKMVEAREQAITRYENQE